MDGWTDGWMVKMQMWRYKMLLVEGRESDSDWRLDSGVHVGWFSFWPIHALLPWSGTPPHPPFPNNHPPKITLQRAIMEKKTPQRSLGGWRGDNVEDYRRTHSGWEWHLGTCLRTCTCTFKSPVSKLQLQSFRVASRSKVQTSFSVCGVHVHRRTQTHARTLLSSNLMLTHSRSWMTVPPSHPPPSLHYSAPLRLIVLLDSFSITHRKHTLNGRYDGYRGYGPQVDISGTLEEEVFPVWMKL